MTTPDPATAARANAPDLLAAFEALFGPQDWGRPAYCVTTGVTGWCEHCAAGIDAAADRDAYVSDSDAAYMQQRADDRVVRVFGGA